MSAVGKPGVIYCSVVLFTLSYLSGHGFIFCLGPKCSSVLFLHIHIEIQIEKMFKENELQKRKYGDV